MEGCRELMVDAGRVASCTGMGCRCAVGTLSRRGTADLPLWGRWVLAVEVGGEGVGTP